MARPAAQVLRSQSERLATFCRDKQHQEGHRAQIDVRKNDLTLVDAPVEGGGVARTQVYKCCAWSIDAGDVHLNIAHVPACRSQHHTRPLSYTLMV